MIPITHGDGLHERIRTAATDEPVTAFIDNDGSYDALATALHVPPGRFSSSVDRGRVELSLYTADGNDPRPAALLRDLVGLVSSDGLHPLTSGFYGFEHLVEAFADLDSGHSRGKIVVGMHTSAPADSYLGSKLRALHAQRMVKATLRQDALDAARVELAVEETAPSSSAAARALPGDGQE